MTNRAALQEARMAALGRAREQTRLDKALARGAGAETPAGLALSKRAVEPVAQALDAWVRDLRPGVRGRKVTVAVLLRGIDPHLCAYLAVRECINGASRRATLTATALRIAEYLADELLADEFEAANGPLFSSVIRKARERGMAPDRVREAVKKAARMFDLAPERWTKAERVRIGTKLIELVVTVTGIVRVEFIQVGRRTKNIISFDENLASWFGGYNNAAVVARPVYLPMIQPPRKWDDLVGGGFHTDSFARPLTLVTGETKERREALQTADLTQVYSGLNALQETPWRINRRVLEVMRQAWEMDAGLPCLPRREDEPIPDSPPEVKADVKGGHLRKEWRKFVRVIHERNAKSRSHRFEFARGLQLAEEHVDFDAIYFPHRLDFRGRAYALATTLNPQGADEHRALLHFAEGKMLGERGVFWLGVHGANLFGNDKVSLEERYQWAKEHEYMARQVAHDPLSNLWWIEADKPWCFLAWCFEWAEAHTYAEPGEFVSHLPIALDGSCNGIQHYSAMLRDPVGGAAVNLVPSPSPQDIYSLVALRTKEHLRNIADDPYGDYTPKQWAQMFLDIGIDRKMTKRQVMTLPYGATFKSCMDYTRQAVRDKLGANDPFGPDLHRASAFLAKAIWASIGDVVIAARQAMDWLQKVAQVCSKAGVPLVWTTPSGFRVCQRYVDVRARRINTRFAGSLIKHSVYEDTKRINRSKQSLAVAPNFVHSLDASAMMLTINACVAEGITSFAMIHDSYGTHAADTERLAHVLRAEFARMYLDHDVLQEFRDEIAAQLPEEVAAQLPPLPSKGTLDIKEVVRSPYFFA